MLPYVGLSPKNWNGGWLSSDGCRPNLDPFTLIHNNLAGKLYTIGEFIIIYSGFFIEIVLWKNISTLRKWQNTGYSTEQEFYMTRLDWDEELTQSVWNVCIIVDTRKENWKLSVIEEK